MTCQNCGLPIQYLKVLSGWGTLQACEVCTDMWLAAAKSEYMVKAQGEWQAEQLRRKAILNGD